jgi:hypothetical protein
MKALVWLLGLWAMSVSAQEIPVTYSLGFPLRGNWWDIANFGFGQPGEQFSGYHLGVDSRVDRTPVGTEVFSPCTGYVRISDDRDWGGYGANNVSNPAYRGYALVIECRWENGQIFTALLGHLQSGSSMYSEKDHTGLAPLGALVYKGQYVGRVASYWNGSGFNSDWHHLHFGIRLGKFSVSKAVNFVTGYSATGWNDNHTVHNNWTDGTAFVLAHSMRTVWHPEGSLLQPYGDSQIYQLVGTDIHHIKNEAVYSAHHFDWNKLLYVTETEISCYSVGWEIDWQPTRTLYRVENTYYLFETQCPSCATGKFYPFATEMAMYSWGYDKSVAQVLSQSELNAKLSAGNSLGPKLYLREGFLAHVGSNFSAGNIYVSLGSGNLAKFETARAFWSLGYDYDDIYFTTPDKLGQSTLMVTDTIVNDNLLYCSGSGGYVELETEPEVQSESDVVQSDVSVTDILDVREEPDVDVTPPAPDIVMADLSSTEVESDVSIITSDVYASDTSSSVTEVTSVVDTSPGEEISAPEIASLEELVTCLVICPFPYYAHIWYGESWISDFERVRMTSSMDEICLRGAPWIDFNCALPDWKAFDFELAYIECNHPTWYGSGKVDYTGEGEIWFLDFSCQN